MHNLDKARLWAETWSDTTVPANTRAAIDIIQSLPDQLVDAEKLREVVEEIRGKYPRNTAGHQMCNGLAKQLEGLIAPSLPTLAELIEAGNDPNQYQWMQCRVTGLSEDERLVISYVDDHVVTLWREDGHIIRTNHRSVTPLPGPKLEWPGSGDTPTVSEQENVALDQAVAKDVCNSESNTSETLKSSINPEDVPDNELWLVELGGGSQWFAKRIRAWSTVFPWCLASMNRVSSIARDSDITLIHKLVPETHTLPEGMRLADHEEYGRIVVSQRTDADGDYAFFESIPGGIAGARWGYVNESELAFLDGEE